MRYRILVDAITLVLLTTSFHCLALARVDGGVDAIEQTSTSAAPSPKQLDTVTVSARRRTENVQDTPISISTFSSYDLEERGVSNISQVGPMTPNVSFDAGSAISGSSNSSTIFIRGVGQTDFNLTIDPGVGLYLDGVYISRSVGSLLDTADISQVEVLRGPQGTLFGKNTIGGAMVLTSRQPDSEPSASAEITTGRYDRLDLKTSFNLPVNDRLAVLGTIVSRSQDGYGQRLSDGQQLGNKNNQAARLVAAWQATDKLKFTLALDDSHTDEKTPPIKVLSLNTSALFPYIYNHYSSYATGCAASTTGANCDGTQWLTKGRYTNWNGDPNYSKSDIFGASLTTDWDLVWGSFKSITAYRNLNSRFWLEQDGAPMVVTNSTNAYKDRQFSQEFQLTGNSFNNRLKWTSGLFYMHEQGSDRNVLHNGSDAVSFLSGGDIDNESMAGYLQGTYALTPKLGFTLGGRYSKERKEFLPNTYVITINSATSAFLATRGMLDVNGDGGPLQAGDRLLPYAWSRTSVTEFTPAATLDYKFTNKIMGYLSYSEGFKAGGFTQRVFPPLTQIPTFAPEYVKSYELGLKNRLFDGRLILNVDVFSMRYTDMQESVTVLFAPTIQNAGRARIRGFEAEFKALPWSWLTINGGVGYTDAKYKEIAAAAAPITLDSKLPDTPEWTGTLGATAYLYNNSYGSMNLRLDANYKAGTYKDAVNTRLLYQSGYTLVNFAANAVLPNPHWSLSAGITNLTDKHYLITGYASPSGTGVVYGIYAPPREWFFKVHYDF